MERLRKESDVVSLINDLDGDKAVPEPIMVENLLESGPLPHGC